MAEQEAFAVTDGSSYEQALVSYLQERIRPGLNSGAIPLVARSIAKDIANGGSEQKLADYLQGRIKPGLNRGAIPLLVRSIAKDLMAGAANEAAVQPEDEAPDEQPEAEDQREAEDQPAAEDQREAEDPVADFEDEMHDLQSELGDDWIVRFSVYRDDAWLTAERTDGSQHVEAQTAAALVKAAKLLDRRGGRSSA